MGTRDVGTQTVRKKRTVHPPITPVPVAASESQESRGQRVVVDSNSYVHSDDDDNIIYHCSFEIFGIVQGVSFRMYTLRKAQKLGIRGWCKNTLDDTLKGEIQGFSRAFDTMRLWLQYTGSPTSRIDKCIFGDVKQLSEFTYKDFTIRMD